MRSAFSVVPSSKRLRHRRARSCAWRRDRARRASIPAHRVNAWCERHLSDRPDIGPSGTPQLGDKCDTHGAGSMYRTEGMWTWDGIADRHKKGRGR